MEFRNKNILIVSQQSWSKLFVSKHHYAIELAKMGNQVFFLNPPDEKHEALKKNVEVIQSKEHPSLFLIYNRLSFPYLLKFHFIGLFHFLMRFHIKKIIEKVNVKLDIIWSFDLAYVYPLNYFPKEAFKIFHPVDPSSDNVSIKAANGADFIFSTASEILNRYEKYDCPKNIINHGLSEVFIGKKDNSLQNDKIRIGISGNLLRHDIDHEVMKIIFRKNPDCIFECWGTKDVNLSKIQYEISKVETDFIREITDYPNVILHGIVPPEKLAEEYQRMNAFLICYDLKAENRLGPNYHKVLEFLSTGKVIVSNYMSPYADKTDIIAMATNQQDNDEMPALFKNVIVNLEYFNATEKQEIRKKYASENTYRKQISRIESIINRNAIV